MVIVIVRGISKELYECKYNVLQLKTVKNLNKFIHTYQVYTLVYMLLAIIQETGTVEVHKHYEIVEYVLIYTPRCSICKTLK